MGFARMALAAAAATLAAAASARDAAEEVTLDAFSVWSATGTVISTGPASHAFSGEMSGPYFVDVGEGPMPAGRITCVGMLEADEATGRQTGRASCRLHAADGAVSYGRFECTGFRLVGCSGTFELTGGEGRTAGVSGSGPITLRRYETALSAGTDGAVRESGLGIAFWRDFAVRVETQQP